MDGPRSVADVLNDHVVFEVECIDRMYCTIDISGLQYTAGLVGYIHQQLGLSIASTAPVAKISDRFSAAVHRFARDRQVPWVDFVRGQRKDDVMHEYLTGYTQTQGVVFIGRAQEKSTVFRAEKRRNAQGVSYPWIVKSTGMVNHYYFYCVDEDFGPFLVTFCSYFPYNARLCLQRKSLGPAPGGKGGDRVHPAGQRVRSGRRPRRATADLRPARNRTDQRTAGQVAGALAQPVHQLDRAAGYR